MTSRLAESQECMRAAQPELKTVLGSKPDMMGMQRETESERERGTNTLDREDIIF